MTPQQPTDDNLLGPKPEPFFVGSPPILFGGLVFLALAGAAFGVTMYRLWATGPNFGPYLSFFYPEMILCAIGVFSATLGVSLLRSAGAASIPPPGPIINPNEWKTLEPEVLKGSEDVVTQYVRLRSLTGFTGVFTKLGLQGLPLATIGLTIFFSLMFLRKQEYLDLAKLTLGAFIGSFVQKQVGERQASGGTVQLPSGEKLSVKPNPSTPS